jgi:hypothetical protein
LSNGFIPIRRSLFDHFLFEEHRVFSRFEAWLDLIQMASFTDENKKIIGGKLIERNRGEVVASLRYLMNRWNWSMSKVCDYLELLRSQQMVVVTKENGVTKILLVNFEKHNSLIERDSKKNSKSRNQTGFDQIKGTAKDTQIDTAREQQGDSEGANINKVNKGNKGNGGGAGAPAHTREEEDMFNAFTEWVDKYTPRVNKMKEPITIGQYLKLREKVSRDVLTKVLTAMQNRGDLLKKYVSAYLTALNWSGRENETVKPESNGPNINDKLKAAGKKSAPIN